MFSGLKTFSMTKGKLISKATWDEKRMEVLHNVMKGRDYGQLRNLISDISR